MKIRLISDIHLDANQGWILPHMEDEKDQVLVIAGDIGNFRAHAKGRQHYFYEDVVERFKKVIAVLGNHDYYGGNIIDALQQYRTDFYALGIELLERDRLYIDGVEFVGTTLWTDFRLGMDYDKAQTYMRDYEAIYEGEYRRVIPETIHGINKENIAFLKHAEALRANFRANYTPHLHITEEGGIAEDKRVLITHHLPTQEFMHPRWAGNELNGAYIASVPHDILRGFDLCVFGHTHDFINREAPITRHACNPKGYGNYEMTNFNPEFIL